MILFLNDWKRYPTAIVDTQTTNKSWLEISKTYRAMGVKNHAFPLALINPQLQGIDPHDPALTLEQITMITYECKINPWYYFREVARVPALAGNSKPKLLANRGNIYLYWSFFNHIFTILIQIRQTGKSLSTDQLMVYLLHLLCNNTSIHLLTKDDSLRRANIERMKDIIECLPYYLNQSTRGDANNGQEITVSKLGNSFHTHLPQMNKMRALNVGRGMTTPIFVTDEGPFQPNIRLSLPAALAAMTAARNTAKENNEPYGVIMTTTAGKINSDSGEYVYSLLQDAAIWTEAFLDARDHEHLYELVKNSSRDGDTLRINGTFSHRQLGKTDEWLREAIKDALSKGEDAERDFLNRWTSGSEGSPFSPEVADRISKATKEVRWVDVDEKFNFIIHWYLPEDQVERLKTTRHLVIGMDTSEASGGDYIGVVIIDTVSLAVVGRAILNNISVYSFIEWTADLLERFPQSTLIPENRSTGSAVIDGLLQLLPKRGIDPFKRIFNWIIQDIVSNRSKYDEIRRPLNSRNSDVYVRYKSLFGYSTSGSGKQSRENLFGHPLSIGTSKFAERINDRPLIDQLLGLEVRKGRIDHADGKHDDLVVSWLLAIWLLTSGQNLTHYGIDPILVMSEPVNTRVISPQEKRMSERQKQLRHRIATVVQELAKEEDETICMKYEHELMFLDRQLVLQDDETFSMEELIRKANEHRRRRHHARRRSY